MRSMRFSVAMTAMLLVLAVPAARGETPSDPAERARVKELVREILKENPEMVLEALQTLEAREHDEANAKSARLLGQYRDRIEHDPQDPVAGNPQGDVTVVEFFDFRCPYCKQVSDHLFETVKDDGKVRLVLKDLPILGRESVIAARAALAAMNQGQAKYLAFHHALVAERGPLDEANVMRIATQVGLDTARIKADMTKADIDAHIKRNLELAHELDVRGTPAFVIGDELIPGATDAANLRAAIQKARGG
jgi:protein-disulfide isomerase